MTPTRDEAMRQQEAETRSGAGRTSILRNLWCSLAHRDQWLGHGEGDWWHLECPKCGVKWAQPR